MHRAIAALAALALTLAVSPLARASSLPRVDFGEKPLLGVGLGANQNWATSGSLSLDVPFADTFLLGGSIATRIDGSVNFDLRGMYRFIEGGKEGPTVAGILGVWGAPGQAGFTLPGQVAPLVGFGLAYPATDQVDLRLNLAYSPFFQYTHEFLTFIGGPPLAGVEVSYQLTPIMEVTLGVNGRGDFLGANLAF
jgi:hypothetical protein